MRRREEAVSGERLARFTNQTSDQRSGQADDAQRFMWPPLVTVAMDEAARTFIDLGIMRCPVGDRTAGIAFWWHRVLPARDQIAYLVSVERTANRVRWLFAGGHRFT